MAIYEGFVPLITGPSGAGKTTIADLVVKDSTLLEKVVTTTTRLIRDGEENGVDYHFIDTESFSAKINSEEFFEWARCYGNLYGSTKGEVERILNHRMTPLFVVDVVGAKAIKEKGELPGLYQIFISPESTDKLEGRLRGRGDNAESIDARMEKVADEINYIGDCDNLTVNVDGMEGRDNAIREVAGLIRDRIGC
jgi:guanylate kinase